VNLRFARAASPAPKCGNELSPKSDAHLPLRAYRGGIARLQPVVLTFRRGWRAGLRLSTSVSGLVESRMGAVAWGLWPTPRFPSPLIGRVEDWRAGLGRCSCSLLSRPFVCECHSISTMPRFQSPPRRTQRADFPLYALLFASPQGLWDLSCRGDFRP